MTTELHSAIRQAIIDFDWANFGLDEVAEAVPEYADELVKRVEKIIQPVIADYDQFVVDCTELIPEGFDDDVAAEEVILNYLRQMDTLAGVIARLTSAYR